MKPYPRQIEIDYSSFLAYVMGPEVRCGMPRNAAFCRRCVILADRFRSPHLWKYEKGEWKLRHTVGGYTPPGTNYLR